MALKELDKSFLRHGTLSDDPDRLKRIDDYVKEFEKDYGRKPTAKNIRTTLKEQNLMLKLLLKELNMIQIDQHLLR